MHRSRLLSLGLSFLLLTACGPATLGTRAQTAHATAAPLPSKELKAAERITAVRLSERLHFVASDEMQGRDTPSPGLDATAHYIADNLKKWGVKPAGDDGTYFQRIALRRTKVDAAQTTAELSGRRLELGRDFLPLNESGAAEGALVYAGAGWVVKAKNINPYEGLDVRDRIVIVHQGRPANIVPADLTGRAGEDWANPATYAQQHGARGLVYVPAARDLPRWWATRQRNLERGTFALDTPEPQTPQAQTSTAQTPQPQTPQPRTDAQTQAGLPAVYASAALLAALFADEPQMSADQLRQVQAGTAAAPFALDPNKRLRFNVQVTTEQTFTQNVVGRLEGKDKTLRQEYVALGAHYDHVGLCTPVGADNICNGADDDGSGTVAVLTIAEAFARSRPARSLLFVWHCGEEKGLWGSRYFTEHPTVPLRQVVAQLNIDMIGRSRPPGDDKLANRELTGPDEIYVIGSQMMSTELGALSERVNSAYLNLAFNYKYDDPRDPNRFFFRSDHYNYAQKGVPIIFYFDGVHEDYHRATDSPDKIDYDKMQKVARTVFLTAAELANAPARPVVDKKLPTELTER
ncbi:MAG TPA: M28 family peptidase [Pyrinomonadaceae bacterium]|jgi:hypothetical protein